MTVRRGPAPASLLRGGPRPALAARSGRSRPTLTTLLNRLTERDIWLLDMLAEHTVLTSAHINVLWNNSLRNTNRRLLTLFRLGVLDSFRPRTARGDVSEHYLLARTGADIVAARHAMTPAALGWSSELLTRTGYSPTLLHDLGVTSFFTSLIAATRQRPDLGQLDAWWSEARCGRVWGDLIHSDAHGQLTRDGRKVRFLLEYDTGTEPHARLAAKLDAYADAAPALGGRPLVLFTVPSVRREAHLHQRLATHLALQAIDVATTARDYTHPGGPAHNPADQVWLRLGRPAHRERLADLPEVDAARAALRWQAAEGQAGPPAPHPTGFAPAAHRAAT